MTPHEQAILDVMVANDEALYLLLDGDGTEAERRRALMDLFVALWGVAYEEGATRGSKATAAAIVAGLSR